MYIQKLNLINSHFGDRSITSGDISLVKNILPHNDVIRMIKEILNNPELLSKIANRSYTHALGFDKIVLMDLSKDLPTKKQKTQLRLHIWNPVNDALPIVESLHEHSFDFISTILSGNIENQMFLTSKISPEEINLLNKIKKFTNNSSSKIIEYLNQQIEFLEVLGLAKLGSLQNNDKNIDYPSVIKNIENIISLTETEILLLPKLEGHFVSNRIAGQRAEYKHILKEYVSLTSYSVLKLHKGDYYFHPYQMPHRLFYDNKELNATILITTPILSNPEGGSLQRPTYVQHEEQSYGKIILTNEVLYKKLSDFLEQLV